MKYITMKTLCEKLDCSRATIYRMTDRGALPKPIMLGRTPRWIEADIDAALSGQVN
jgi:excisionase family DNA binding protein